MAKTPGKKQSIVPPPPPSVAASSSADRLKWHSKSLAHLLERHLYLFLLLARASKPRPNVCAASLRADGAALSANEIVDHKVEIQLTADLHDPYASHEVELQLDRVLDYKSVLFNYYEKCHGSFSQADDGPDANTNLAPHWWQLQDFEGCQILNISSKDVLRYCWLVSVELEIEADRTAVRRMEAAAYPDADSIWAVGKRVPWCYAQRLFAAHSEAKDLYFRTQGHPNVWHSQDFQHVIWKGVTYNFNRTQADIIKLLWDYWERGDTGLGGPEMARMLDKDPFRVDHIFRNHPAFKIMILKVGPNRWALAPLNQK